jgi:hypothetical protein
MELVVDNKPEQPATTAQVAAIEFESIKEFRNFTSKQRTEKVHALLDYICPMAVLSLAICGKDRNELATRMANVAHEAWEEFLDDLEAGVDYAQVLIEVMQSAAARISVVLAEMELSGPPPAAA